MVKLVPEFFGNAFILEVGLTVEIFRLDVAHPLLFRTFHDDHISWEKLVLLDFDEVSDLDVAPTNIFKALLSLVVSSAERVIFFIIFTVSTIVLIGVLAHRGEHNQHKWRQHGRLAPRNRNYLDSLHDCDEKKVDICGFGKLLEKIDWQESEPIVHARSHDIVFDVKPELFELLVDTSTDYRDGALFLRLAEAKHLLEAGKAGRYALSQCGTLFQAHCNFQRFI